MIDDAHLTTLLHRWNSGEQNAEAILMQAMFSTFHALASSRLRRFTNSQLCPGDLVSEAYLRLHWTDVEWNGPAHFISTVTTVMRNIIVDHERAQHSEKRGGGIAHVPFDTLEHLADEVDVEHAIDRRLLHEKIDALWRVDRRQSRVAELKILCGLTTGEIARELAISRASVVRLWRATLAYFAAPSKDDDAWPGRTACREPQILAELAL
jgi:RNA polymerase sigma factor (TIGR02999 family)